MAIVVMPDGTKVNLPDNPTPEERQQIMQLLPGTEGLVPGPKTFAEKHPTLAEIGRTADKAVRGGLLMLPSLGLDLMAKGADWVTRKTVPGAENMPPNAGFKRPSETLQDLTGGPLGAPRTTLGRTVGELGEGAVAAIASPGGLAAPIRSALTGVGATAGAEAGGNIGGTPGALVGGLVGGGAAGLLGMSKTNRALLAREALKGVSEEDLRTAISRQRAAEELGMPINLSQAMPSSSNIDTYVNTLASSPQGTRVQAQLRSQPAQVEERITDMTQRLPGTLRDEQVLANNMQEATSSAISREMGNARKAWERVAGSAVTARIPQKGMQRLDAELSAIAQKYNFPSARGLVEEVRQALKAPEGPKILGPDGKPINNQKFIDEALQVKATIDDVLSTYGPSKLNTPTMDRRLNAVASEIRQAFSGDGRVLETFAPQLKNANRAYEQYMSSVVEPMKKSVVGRLAGRAGENATTEAARTKLYQVFDRGTLPGQSSSEILTLERTLREAGRAEEFQDAAKSWMATRIDNALAKSRDNRLPENFIGNLRGMFGDPRRADATSQGFKDILAGLARSQNLDPATYIRGFERLMSTVADMARRPANVAGTSSQAINELAESGITRRIGHFSPLTALRQPALAWASALRQDALGKMDELLTSSKGTETLMILGREPRMSQKAVTALATFLGTTAAVEPEIQP